VIVVTTPTGQIGFQLLKSLLAADEAVRVVVRDPAKLPADIRGKVEIVKGSHGDPTIVKTAFRNADALFWLVPPDPKAKSVEAAYVDFSRPACDAFLSEGVKHVVGVSSLGRDKPQAKAAGNITASLLMDDLIAGTGVSYRALACSSFMDNFLRQVASIKDQGVFFSPTPGDLKLATCATRDIAATAARLLIDRSWSGTGEIPVLGPEELSFNEMAQVMSHVLDKAVRFEEISIETLRSGLLGRGISEAMAQATVDMMLAVRQGIYSNAPRTVESSTATSFHQWCEEVLKPVVLKKYGRLRN
jgi:uncharacterized protein YbjT (DUF2867 family)